MVPFSTHSAILDQLAEGVIVTDAAGKITFVNDAAAAIHGVARLDVEPDAYSETYHLFTEDGAPYEPCELPLARAVRGETVMAARWRIHRPDGTDVLAIGSARPLRGPAGQIGAVLTLSDDTAREAAERSLRQSETALRELNANLAERVAERTREAGEAQAEAEAASRAKSDFLAAMSHEIRTPLSGILGYTDLMLDEPTVGPSIRLHAERIRSAGHALLTIVNDILDFSKVEAGLIELKPESFAPRYLAEEAISIVRAGADRKHLALRIDIPDDLPEHLVGDRDRLRQILLNLLNNAIKFTRSGSVTLCMRPVEVEAGIVRLRFMVADTGIGIPAEKHHLLFQRFSQIDGTIQREFGGTGLGLAICKRLAELMGGTIGLESEVGRGSIFWFEVSLPLAARAVLTVVPTVCRPIAPRALLLVEDVVVNQEMAKAILERGGHSVDVVGGGGEAVAAVQAKRYDLVLMDIQMPGIDGITATRLIRQLDHPASNVPIVAMSANVLAHQVASYEAAGMQDHIGKPFRRDVLFAVIDRWALRGAAAAEAEPVLDRTTFDELTDALGREQIDKLLASLARELQGRLGADGTVPDRRTLALDAHALVSATRMLGFTALADLCRDVGAASACAVEYGALIERLHKSRGSALAAIATLRAA